MYNTLDQYKKFSIMFSNIKGVLIYLVVLGHLIEATPSMLYSFEGSTLTKFIYSFHMEAFVFVSGFFSKTLEPNFMTNLRKYIKPYYTLLFIVCLSRYLFSNEPVSILLYPLLFPYYPVHSTWYLLTLFYYRLFLQRILMIKGALILSLALYFIIPCINTDLECMSVGRAISFLPFFLMGYYVNSHNIEFIKSISIKLYIFPVLCYLTIFIPINRYFHHEFFYLKYTYDYFCISLIYGIYGRLCLLLLALIMIALLIKTVPNTETIFTNLGIKSLTIYMLHLPFVYFSQNKPFFNNCSYIDFFNLFLYCIITVYILSKIQLYCKSLVK